MQQVWHLQSLSSLTPVSYSEKVLQADVLDTAHQGDVYLFVHKISSQKPCAVTVLADTMKLSIYLLKDAVSVLKAESVIV